MGDRPELPGVQDQRPVLYQCPCVFVDEKTHIPRDMDEKHSVFIVSEVPFKPTLVIQRNGDYIIHGVHSGYQFPPPFIPTDEKAGKRQRSE
jgi:hypothetical protein